MQVLKPQTDKLRKLKLNIMQIADRSCENRRSDGWDVGAVLLIFFIPLAYNKNDVMRQVLSSPSPHSSKPCFGLDHIHLQSCYL